jgi:LysM repeat protein
MLLTRQKRNAFRPLFLAYFAALFAILFLVGCPQTTQELIPEKDEKAYRRGLRFLKEGNHTEALVQFEEVINSRREAPESHLEVGLICLDKLNDPVSAYYHFKRYLAIEPDSENAPRVREQIQTAMKEFMRSLPGEPFLDEVERLDIYTRLQSTEEQNTQLRGEVARLRQELSQWQEHSGALERQLAAYRNQSTAEPAPIAPIVVEQRIVRPGTAAGQTGRTYTVQAGDTLSKISREQYGNSGRWRDIFEANRDQLPSQNALRPGQVLKIP